MRMFSEIKVAEYSGSIEDLIGKQPYKFFNVPIGRNDVTKYASVIREGNDSFVLMISRTGENFRNKDFNIEMSVQGAKESRVKEISKDVQERMGIETRQAPPYVYKNAEIFQKVFEKMFESL
ncbi:MAG: hypothetical protein WA139_04720 [Candidatus Aenigmatarchaeota archaeon]